MDMYMLNGSPTPAAEAKLHVSDLGLQRGYAVFDFFRVVGGVPLFIDDYLARFERSVARLHLALPFSLVALKRQVHDLIKLNEATDAGFKFLLTGGYTPDGYTPAEPNLLMMMYPYRKPDERLYSKGATLITHEYVRAIPEVKTTNYAVAISLLPQQREAGAVDILYHQGGLVSETARSSIFAVKDGVVRTPGDRILKGVTRKQVLALAKNHFDVLEAGLTLDDLKKADEVFITSSIKGVMPIVALGGVTIGAGQPGEVVNHLMKLFEEHVEAYVANYSELATPVAS